MSAKTQIYTDGACRGNPGVGGWGVLLLHSTHPEQAAHSKQLYGGEYQTTNNRMELLAAINGLKSLRRACEVTLYTDSQYVRKGITEWIINWKKNNWKTAAKKPVKNADLWRQLDELVQLHQVEWIWVKGHAGNEGNEIADALANKGIDSLSQEGVDDV